MKKIKLILIILAAGILSGCCQGKYIILQIKKDQEIERQKKEIKMLSETVIKERIQNQIIINNLLKKIHECTYDEI